MTAIALVGTVIARAETVMISVRIAAAPAAGSVMANVDLVKAGRVERVSGASAHKIARIAVLVMVNASMTVSVRVVTVTGPAVTATGRNAMEHVGTATIDPAVMVSVATKTVHAATVMINLRIAAAPVVGSVTASQAQGEMVIAPTATVIVGTAPIGRVVTATGPSAVAPSPRTDAAAHAAAAAATVGDASANSRRPSVCNTNCGRFVRSTSILRSPMT